ncbi:hypothetical protein STIUS_v1c02540 [Spiroplasma sp. TIUS-1]|uniref:hypothetical protein n=1 Tax=Spiroplasma sp. TIUS-1 TaxID=216963 RepID=UPI001396D331|nr:hypothetical protein [Spiroplasma sp. TIUS-1]QHX35808.1 hypothetical protein STIUS_v1c02540 [Spiroplasma sp. TIUS-1]
MKKLLSLLTSITLLTIPVMGIVSCGTGTPNIIKEKTNISNTMSLSSSVNIVGSKQEEPKKDYVLKNVYEQIIKESRIPSDIKHSDLISSDYFISGLDKSSVLNNDKDYSGYVVFTVKEDNYKYIGSINVTFFLTILEIDGGIEIIVPGDNDGEWVENEEGDPWNPGGSTAPPGGGGTVVPEGPGGNGTGKWPTNPESEKYMTDLTRFDVGEFGKINEKEFLLFKSELLNDLRFKNESQKKFPSDFFIEESNFTLNFADGYGFDSNGFQRNKKNQQIVFSLQSKEPFLSQEDNKYYIGNFKIAFSNAISNTIETNVIFDESHPPTSEDYDKALLTHLVETLPSSNYDAVLNYDSNEAAAQNKYNFSDWYDFTLWEGLPSKFGEEKWIEPNPYKMARPKVSESSEVLKRKISDIAIIKEIAKIKSIDLSLHGQTELAESIVIEDDAKWEEVESKIWKLGTSQISKNIHNKYNGYDEIPEIKREYFNSESNEQAWITQIQKVYSELGIGEVAEVDLKATIDSQSKQVSFINTLSIKIKVQRKPRYTDKMIKPIKLVADENTNENDLYNIFLQQIRKNLFAFNDRRFLERSNDGLKEAFDKAWLSKNTWVNYKQNMPNDTEPQPEILVAIGKICIGDSTSVIEDNYSIDFKNEKGLAYYINGPVLDSQVNSLSDRIFKFAQEQLMKNASFKDMEGVSSLKQDWTDEHNKTIYDILKTEIEAAIESNTSSFRLNIDFKSAVKNTPFKGQIEVTNLEIIMVQI